MDREILAVINTINTFRLYLGFKEFTVRTDCEAICRYYNKVNSKKSSTSVDSGGACRKDP